MTIHTSAPTFEPPGPGGWKRLGDHFPGVLTPEYQRLYAETSPPGMAAYMANYGVLARTVDVAFVQGHLYVAPVPLAGPREMKHAPPAFAIWLMARLHPEFRRRTRAARRAVTNRPWRSVAEHWFSTERAQWHDRNRSVQDLDPSAMDTTDLIGHLRACRQLVADGYLRHFELHGDDLLPIGLLIARCAEWGVDAATAFRALDGITPAPSSTEQAPDWRLVTGYDLDSLAACETPGRFGPVTATHARPIDLRTHVAPADHDELDALVSDARAAVPLRDDNGALTGAWPMGLLRRAMLESGRRLRFGSPDLAVEATVDELVERLEGAAEPSGEQLQDRRADRMRRSALAAPSTLGPEFAIPPLDALPRPLALIGAAQLATADHMFDQATPVGVGEVTYTGRAIVVSDPATAIDMIEPGDVIITASTSPSWNSILALAGAVVTTTGGLVSHAAVIARELDIPAVIGDATAFDRFSTGVIVTVDPLAGTVTSAVSEFSRS